jgi:hypothetical protein
MVHRSEAVLPTGIDYGSMRVRAYTDEGNQVSLKDARLARRGARRRTTTLRSVSIGDAVLPWPHRPGKGIPSQGSGATLGPEQQRLPQPPWEGPIIVVQVSRPGTYKLKDEDNQPITNTWNIEQLSRFYP